MKQLIRHIILTLMVVLTTQMAYAQKKRYVELNSIHALSVPENPDYKFEWTINYGATGTLQEPSTTNVTQNIHWTNRTTYNITVRPILDSVGCYGEPVSLQVIVVDYLSLHTFDDVYFTDLDTPVSGDVSENDFDETGARIDYNPTPVIPTQHGTLEFSLNGTFTYTPNAGFVGTDYFVYEAFNDHDIPMFTNSMVAIVVRPPSTQANLYVEKTGPVKALFGERITYSLLVSNNGPDVAYNVILRDTLAFGLFNAEYAVGIGSHQPWNKNISLGNMNPGDSVFVSLYADISDFSPDKIYNQAIAYSDTYDPEHLNNDSIWMTEVSQIYVDLPGQIFVPSCDTRVLPGANSNANNPIAKYEWIPGHGLSDSTIATPTFTPDDVTIGKTSMYVLRITDVEGFVAIDTTYIIVPEVPVAIITGDTLFKDIGENIFVYGDQSIGEGLDYDWWTYNGAFKLPRNVDSIEVLEIGTYYLEISDELGCADIDSVIVLFESHPPIAINDSIAIQAASDSIINVLDNDSDINLFDLHVSRILTEPKHSAYTWDSEGNFNIRPDSLFWAVDSIEYEVCNNGYPVQCSSAWIIIDALRPPLNADVEIMKTGDNIAFWGDSVEYDLTVWSNGPDSATVTRIHDPLPDGVLYPKYSLDNGNTWSTWTGSYTYRDSLLPGEVVIRIKIKAYVHPTADRFITNKAWIDTEILENKYSNDTATWVTKVKEPVIADAGPDISVGSCSDPIELDATGSSGENLTYLWSPSNFLDDPTSPTPTYTAGSTTTYILTITDDDGVSDKDTIVVTALPPPLADAGPDKFIKINGSVLLDGYNSSGAIEYYQWSTINGHINGKTNDAVAIVDSVGTYTLTVTDETGCTDSDIVEVFQFYYHPFAIPDYYSTKLATKVNANVLDNDYEPNGLFNLSVTAGSYTSEHGGQVFINADGSFVYTPPGGYIGVDAFTYEVCNDAYPPRCSTGYVKITIKQDTQLANLTITKDAIQPEALLGDPDGVQFRITITNEGPATATDVWVTDSLSEYLINPKYRYNGSQSNWRGDLRIGDLNAGDTKTITITATAGNSSPDRVYNAATVTSKTYDALFDWNDVANRNVDTASVKIVSDLLAIAELVELKDNKPYDFTVGYCDNVSYLTGEKSKSRIGIDGYYWTSSIPGLLTTPNAKTTYFTHALADTIVEFELVVRTGDRISTAKINVNFSPELIADAGPDKKKNENIDLIIDATGSQGAGAVYTWYNITNGINTKLNNFANGNVLTPIITEPGTYELSAVDMHGCTDIDYITVSENDLYAVNDFIVVIANDTIVANVLTNDYDPNEGDSIYYSGDVSYGPSHGKLLDNPDSYPNLKSASAINVKIGSDGRFIYVPNPGYIGYDYFKYEVCDNNDPDLCVQGTVYIKVIDVDNQNSPPVANHDYIFVNKNDTATTNLMNNDFDFDGGIVTLGSIVTMPTKGTIQYSANGDFRYVPYANATGFDNLVYQICDNGVPSKCDTARVTINILKVASPENRPVAIDDAFYVVEKQIRGNVMDNDYDPIGGTIFVNDIPVSGPYHGTFELDRNGDFTYLPDASYEGTDQVVYELRKQGTLISAYATVYLVSIDEKRYTTDVAIQKFAPDVILSGETIEYKLIASVKGPSLANDIVMSDTLFNSLTNYRFSNDNGVTWKPWNYATDTSQVLLYGTDTILIRADIPDVWSGGKLVNIARVSHDMNEKTPSNNTSRVETDVYQRVIARPGDDITIGSCVEEFKFDATSSLGMSTLKYEWSPRTLLDNPDSPTPIFTTEPGQTTVFTLVVSSELNGYFDQDTATVTITVAPTPIANAGADWWPDNNDPYTLDGSRSSGAGPLQYTWWTTDKDNNVVVIANTDTVTVSRSGDYSLTITDAYGCQSTDLMHVTYPIDEFIAIDDTIYTYQQMPVDIYVLRNDIIDKLNDEYDLTTLLIIEPPLHGFAVTNVMDSMFTYTPEDYYSGPDEFIYTISTKAYTGQATVHIIVLERRPIIPQGFSPNGDGINDVLIIPNIELYRDNHIVIFNRWGNIVYEKTNYDNNDPWNGVANKGIRVGNGAVPTGVYYYIIDLGDDERIIEEERTMSGGLYIATDNSR